MPRRQIAPGRSCLECHRRKIKCDRSHPCSYCVRVKINCKYPAQRRHQDEDALTRVTSLETNLQAVEKRLSEIGQILHSSPTQPSTEDDKNDENRNQDLTIDPSTPSTLIDLAPFRPPPATIALLWQRYLEVVDPLLKVFHTPTVQKLVLTAIHGRHKLDLASECLLFAIYYATVASMSPSDCKIELEEERYVLLKRHRTAVDHLLSGLNLPESLDMTGLQAFTIYLITGRRDEKGPDVYALIGLAIGIALKIGLNRDGAPLGLRPFEVEMRRRLWWQLCILDIRIAEDRHSDPCILESSFNTRLPSNIADSSLHREMSQLPDCGQGRTEMLYSLVRFEVSYFARQMVFSDGFREENEYMSLSTSQKSHAIDLFRERIEMQYLSHCDDNIPFDLITVRSVRLVLAKLKLMGIDEGREQQECPDQRTGRQRAWMNILQDAEKLRGYESGKQWLWLFQTYIEWDALARLLLYLRVEPCGREADLAWELAYRVYEYWQHSGIPQRDKRWVQIQELRQQVLTERRRITMGLDRHGVTNDAEAR